MAWAAKSTPSASGATARLISRCSQAKGRPPAICTPSSSSTAPGAVLELDGVHMAAGRPFAWEHRLISLAVAPDALGVDFAAQAPGSWLLSHIPWTEARHRITARSPDAEAARRLQLPTTTACLQVERWTWRQAEPVTYVRQLFPGDAFDLVAEFTPRGSR